MKKTMITLLALAGVAVGGTQSSAPLTVLNNTYGTLIGGYNSGHEKDYPNQVNNAITTTGAFSINYNSMVSVLKTSNEWYVSSWNGNVGGITPNDAGVTIVAGGPSTPSASGAIKFTLTADTLSQYAGAITLSFDVAISGGNGKKNHDFTFSLLGTDIVSSKTYTSPTADNQQSTGAQSVALIMSEEQVATMQASGLDQTLVFMVTTNEVTGSNRSILMNNFALKGELVPEPATATLSLLALAGLAARRRRK